VAVAQIGTSKRIRSCIKL